MDWLTLLSGDGVQAIVAGIFGGLVASFVEGSPFVAALRRVVAGGACAFYMAPVVFPLIAPVLGAIDVEPERSRPLAAFIAGGSGLLLMEIVLTAVRERLRRLTRKRPADGERGGTNE